MAEPLWTVDELIAATGGKLAGTVTAKLDGVSIDSRSIKPGDIFVAIRGERHDGHDFVTQAMKAGAGLAVVARADQSMREAGPLLVVENDPLHGLENMGRAARKRSKARIVAVTGSVGKTSTKEMLRTSLAASGMTHASDKSFNNHWGVPLTLARMRRETAYGVFEIGMNHPGEITPLVAMVQPHVAVVTAVAASHLGNFPSLDAIADAKAEIFTGVVQCGHAIINRDSAYFSRLAAAAHKAGIAHVVGFGHHPEAHVRIEKLALHDNCCCVTANIMGEHLVYKLGLPGEHMAMNSLAVLSTVELLGADLARGALALASAQPAEGRGLRHVLAVDDGEIILIDESYNANPASMSSAFGLLAHTRPGKHGRRIAVLGDMLELGEQSAALHAGLAEAVDAGKTDVLYACGPLMAHLWEATPKARRGAYAENSEALKDFVLNSVQAGDAIMIKGSLGSRMGIIVEALKARYKPANREI
jgi:UDP-N-acetylmuramoyl-tripeptide--D-alanyl-D-alanine ligase